MSNTTNLKEYDISKLNNIIEFPINIPEELPFAISKITDSVNDKLDKGKVTGNSKKKSILLVIDEDEDLDKVSSNLGFISNSTIFTFPELNTDFFEPNQPSLKIAQERIETLSKITSNKTDNKENLTLITTPKSLLAKTMPIKVIKDRQFFISQGEIFDPIFIRNQCVNFGYKVSDDARKIGEVSLIGQSLSIAINDKNGCRVIFDEDAIESIVLYDLISQKVVKKLNEICIHPISEAVMNEESLLLFKEKYTDLKLDSKSIYFESIMQDLYDSPSFFYLPLFYKEELSSINEYINPDIIIFYNNALNQTLKYIHNLPEEKKRAEDILGKNTTVPIDCRFISTFTDITKKSKENKPNKGINKDTTVYNILCL